MIYAPADLALLQVAPVATVPLHGKFEPLKQNGHRYLIASNGLFMEVKRDWMHVIWPDGCDHQCAKPYGALQPYVHFAFGRIPGSLLERFYRDAHAAGDVEIAACLKWNSQTQSLHYSLCEAVSASAARIDYRRPDLQEHESYVLDLHSHGFGKAFFSADDDADDCGEFKIAGVIGNVNRVPTWCFRLCLIGRFIEVPSPSEAIVELAI